MPAIFFMRNHRKNVDSFVILRVVLFEMVEHKREKQFLYLDCAIIQPSKLKLVLAVTLTLPSPPITDSFMT